MSMTISETQKGYKIQFPYSPWLVEKVKTIPGRYFESKEKVCIVPKSSEQQVRAFAAKMKIGIGDPSDKQEPTE